MALHPPAMAALMHEQQSLPIPMLIAQLSDPHIRPRGVLYHDTVDSNAMFQAAVRRVNALTPQPDVVILSGDLVDQGSPEEYEMASTLLAELAAPLLVI